MEWKVDKLQSDVNERQNKTSREKFLCVERDLNSHLRVRTAKPVQIPLETTNFCRLQCQINMNLVFDIAKDGSEIELKHCASSRTSVKSFLMFSSNYVSK